jgi:DNA repair protein RecN (Recombination protein N)
MLLELRIRNFAIIEQVALSFGPGLNIISGETGAGKTIIMNALGLLIGGRASSEVIRGEQKEAIVEGLFELEGEASGPTFNSLDRSGPEILIRRVIAEGGRSRASINDELATVQSLGNIGSSLVQIYGQHESQSLTRVESHLGILDSFAGLEAPLAAYQDAYQAASKLRARLDELAARTQQRDQLLEIAGFQINELERFALVPNEDVDLAARRALLANATKLAAAANESEELLYGGDGAAIDTVSRVQRRLSESASLDPRLAPIVELLGGARTSLEEAAHSLRLYADRSEADPAQLEQIENRIQDLQRIKRKYGGSIASALEALAKAKSEAAELESAEESKADLERGLKRALADLEHQAASISAVRRTKAAELKRLLEIELKSLGMRSATFDAHLAPLGATQTPLSSFGVALGPNGAESVEFLFSANLGQPPLPLAKVASGGELSRVMLALKQLEARRRSVATVIFDEVDAGIGGAIAEVVGRKLRQLSRFHQVLCITHLPQIAAFGDSHFVVEKEERRGVTLSRVSALDKSSRAQEIARMIGGTEITAKMIRAAKELIARAQS